MTDDLRTIVDVVIGTLLAQGLRLAVMEGIVKPKAAKVGRDLWAKVLNLWGSQ